MSDLREEMERIAGSPAPPSAVDIGAALARGRRVRRVRRAVTAAMAAGAVAAAAGVAALPSLPDERPDRVLKPSGYPPPLIEKAVFGWLPAGYERTRITQNSGPAAGHTVTAGKTPGPSFIDLKVLPRGVRPGVPLLPGARKGRLTKAAPVNGRPAYWSIKPGEAGSEQVPAEFRWEFAPETWALLSIGDRAIADVATVRRIAAGVRFDGNEPVKFPVRVTGLPAGLEVRQARFGTEPVAEFQFGVPDGNGELMIALAPASERTRNFFKPNTTVDGHEAFDTALPHPGPKIDRVPPSRSRSLHVFGVRGFDIRIDATGEPLRRLRASGGLTGLYRRVTPLGADPARWTATPLR